MKNDGRLWLLLVSGVVLSALVSVEAGALGARETAVRDVRDFDSVTFATAGELIITQGDREGLEVAARAEDLPNIVTEVNDGTLTIGWRGAGPAFSFRPPVFHLSARTVTGLETRSSGTIAVNRLRAGSLRVRITSAGGIAIDSLAADTLDVRIVSSGSFRVAGRVEQQDALLSSSGTYSAGSLASTTARVRVSSSGSATVRVSDSLEASVTSSGDLRYHGRPSRVDGKPTSSGRLVDLGG